MAMIDLYVVGTLVGGNGGGVTLVEQARYYEQGGMKWLPPCYESANNWRRGFAKTSFDQRTKDEFQMTGI